ncbi:MAG: hypothetical protein IJY52_03720, partial [Anaerotignum sp.]|nr:hypothetical protein [Anaerotignum sp.]
RNAVYPLSNAEERGYLFLLGEAEGALLEGEYKGEVIPLEIGKSDVNYEFFQRSDDAILCTIRLPLEGTLQGGEGTFLSAKARGGLEDLFEGLIKQEVEHTMKIAEQADKDLFGILPRLEQKAPELAQGYDTQDELWDAMRFEFQPELELKDMGRKR